MKIAIPVVDLKKNRHSIAGGLNSLGQLCIYNDQTKEAVWVKSSDLAENMGELLPALEKKGISEIITAKILPMALQVLVHKGFHVYKSEGTHLEENLMKYDQKVLPIFDMESALSDASICGGACADCNTTCETPDSEPTN